MKADRPDIIGLPEVWTCLGGKRVDKTEQAEFLPRQGSNEGGGPAYEFLRATARAHKLHVHGGSLLEREGDRLFNTTVVFAPDGAELARYRKIDLFDITAPDGAGYRESATFGADESSPSTRAVSGWAARFATMSAFRSCSSRYAGAAPS